MQELKYLESHIGSLEGCVTLANQFLWGLEIKEGMGLAYCVIPEDYVKQKEFYLWS